MAGSEELLDEAQLAEALAGLPAWRHEGGALVREVELASFWQAVAAIVCVAEVAEAQGHHPDLTLRYRRLGFSVTTHSAGGLTRRDLALAAAIDQRLAAFGVPAGGPPPGAAPGASGG
jgi:4a-hydroxytetrahydrobiopterin dehydratase